MLYTEWLRVRGTLKWISIVLGILLLFCVIARVATLRYDATAFIHGLQTEPDSKVTVTTLPDGTKRTLIVNDREQIRATIDDRGYDGQRIDVIDRKPHHDDSVNMMMGSVSIQTSTAGSGRETVIDTNTPTFFGDFTIIGLVMAFYIASTISARRSPRRATDTSRSRSPNRSAVRRSRYRRCWWTVPAWLPRSQSAWSSVSSCTRFSSRSRFA